MAAPGKIDRSFGLVFAAVAGFALFLTLIALTSSLQPFVGETDKKPAKPATVSAHGLKLTSVSLDLPEDDMKYPAGPHADVINANCTACHSATMALYQPRLTAPEWTAEVNKMRQTYMAPVSEANVPDIVAYLTNMSDQRQ